MGWVSKYDKNDDNAGNKKTGGGPRWSRANLSKSRNSRFNSDGDREITKGGQNSDRKSNNIIIENTLYL